MRQTFKKKRTDDDEQREEDGRGGRGTGVKNKFNISSCLKFLSGDMHIYSY